MKLRVHTLFAATLSLQALSTTNAALRLGALFLPALAACSGSDDDELMAGNEDAGGSLDGGSADGSTPGSGDDGGGPGTDGGTGTDASTSRGPMDFTLRYNRRPVSNAVVMLHNAEGVAIERLVTDALGQVHPAVAPHMLTVLPPLDFLQLMQGGPISYLGVEPGDNLVIDLDQIGVDSPSQGSYSVTLPSLVDSANLYWVYASSDDCGYGASSDGVLDESFPLYTQCIRPDGIDLFAVAMEASSGPLKYAYATNQPVPAAATVQDAALTKWVDPDLVTVTLANGDAIDSPRGSVVSYRRGGRYWTGTSEGTPLGGNAWQYHTALGFFDTLGFGAAFSSSAPGESLYVELEQLVVPTSALTVDLALALPPTRVSDLDLTTFTRPILTIVPEAPGTADATVINIEFSADTMDGTPFYTFWTFVVPPDATRLQLPDLSVYTEHLSTSLDNATNVDVGILGVVAYDIDTVPDYGAFRQLTIDFTSYIEGQSFDVRRPTPSLQRRTYWQPSEL